MVLSVVRFPGWQEAAQWVNVDVLPEEIKKLFDWIRGSDGEMEPPNDLVGDALKDSLNHLSAQSGWDWYGVAPRRHYDSIHWSWRHHDAAWANNP